MSEASGAWAPQRLVRPRLLVITDTIQVAPARLLERVSSLCACALPRTVMVQLRDRELPIAARVELGRRLREITRAHDQWFAVNDRIDLARLLEADGLHLGERSVAPADARLLWGRGFISRACHDPNAAVPDGADAIVLSPVVADRKGQAALGFAAVRQARVRAGRALLIALGGIEPQTAAACLAAGADAVAAIGAALCAPDPTPLLAALGVLDGRIRVN